MSNPYVFIVGCPRSGTTLLQRIVNAHPRIAVTPESYWIPWLFAKGEGLTPDACWWAFNVRLGHEAGRSLPSGLYYELRYEALIAHPREQCEKLCPLLGLPFDEAMLRFHEDGAGPDPGLELKRAGLPVTPGLRDWQSQMPAQELERFEAAAGELLDELNYPCCSAPQTRGVGACGVGSSLVQDPRAHD